MHDMHDDEDTSIVDYLREVGKYFSMSSPDSKVRQEYDIGTSRAKKFTQCVRQVMTAACTAHTVWVGGRSSADSQCHMIVSSGSG